MSKAESTGARGARAEERAAQLLLAAGFRILARNFRCRMGEIDIIARRANLLIIAEVRLRSSDAFGGAAASVTGRKRARIVRTTRYLLLRKPALNELQVRFDTLLLRQVEGPIEWLEDVFGAGTGS
jgi:putative endonuclease